jgi:hypothetical protein
MHFMKIFGPVLAAILVAALIITAIKAFHDQTEGTRIAEDNLQRAIAHADAYLSVYKALSTPSPSPSPTAASRVAPSSDIITLVKPAIINTGNRATTVPAGTSVRIISRRANNVWIHYGNADYEIPVDATDLAK